MARQNNIYIFIKIHEKNIMLVFILFWNINGIIQNVNTSILNLYDRYFWEKYHNIYIFFSYKQKLAFLLEMRQSILFASV